MFKDDLIAQSLAPVASVSAIAMKSGINANLLFKWRREYVRAKAQIATGAATLLPVCIVPDADPISTDQTRAPVGSGVNRHTRPGVIEVEIAGAQLRIRGAVDETTLGSVLRALRQSE